jgi:hypothetical protein
VLVADHGKHLGAVLDYQLSKSFRISCLGSTYELQIQLVFGGLAPFSRQNIVCRVILVFGFSAALSERIDICLTRKWTLVLVSMP